MSEKNHCNPEKANDIKGKRTEYGILDDYREHDPKETLRIILPLLHDKNGNPCATEENIEEILDKIFNNNGSQE